ncbi:MAG: Gfo/Idh/MocA family oxidoreductase [Anaerolineae bacterium]|nr:Gfo/Idh/MocA family oxidoreductase [Anaerolineae bacterium]
MTALRYAVIGIGAGISRQHLEAIKAVGGEIVGVVDINAEVGQYRAGELGCPYFPDTDTLLAEAPPDVASIITPHPFHAPQAIQCLEAGVHVLVEKPIAVEVAESDAMIAAAERAGRLLAVNFQQRLRPEIVAAHRLIQDGHLGKIQNADMKMTWTRTASYYRTSPWRGTWNGEGGGVLLNQAPHELDLLCYLLGLPARVLAWTRTTGHAIETEDTIQVMLEWPDGGLGSIHVSTAEAGQGQRFEIIGTGGHLGIHHGALDFKRFEMDVREFIATSDQFFSAPALRPEPVEIGKGEGEGNHSAIYRNLERAIREGGQPIAPALSASLSLELANAIAYSSYTNQPVEFPLDRTAYSALLARLRAKAREA